MSYFIQVLFSFIFVMATVSLPLHFALGAEHKFHCSSLDPNKTKIVGIIESNNATFAIHRGGLDLFKGVALKEAKKPSLGLHVPHVGGFYQSIYIPDFYDGSKIHVKATYTSGGGRIFDYEELSCSTSCSQCTTNFKGSEFCEKECNCPGRSCFQW